MRKQTLPNIIKERDSLQRKAEKGEITPSEYLRELQRTWELMTKREIIQELHLLKEENV